MQLVVPITVELVSMERQRLHLCFRCNHPSRIRSLVELGFDPKPCGRSRLAYQVDNGLKGTQRLASPILREVTKQAVLNLVPLARAGRKMADVEAQTRLVSDQNCSVTIRKRYRH